MMLCLKSQFTVHVSHISYALEFIEAKKLAMEQLIPQSGQFLILESVAIKIVSLRFLRQEDALTPSLGVIPCEYRHK